MSGTETLPSSSESSPDDDFPTLPLRNTVYAVEVSRFLPTNPAVFGTNTAAHAQTFLFCVRTRLGSERRGNRTELTSAPVVSNL